jgi:hypothetical protein
LQALSDVLPSEIGCEGLFDISHELIIVPSDGIALVDTASEHSMSKKSSVPPEHDREARDRIRNRLLHYMREHGIGAPELTVRIYNAQEPKQLKPVGISTVQRFLANKVRTVESYVDMFERFTKDFPSPDPLREVGKSMAAFYGTPSDKEYAGVYSGNGVLVSIRKDFERPFNSQVVISSDAEFWRITEATGHPDHAIYDGVLVCSGKAVIAVMKDRLRGLPRTYTVWPRSDDKLHGCGTTEHWGDSHAIHP